MEITFDLFLERLREGRLVGARCRKCRSICLPPRTMCVHCRSPDVELEELKPEGRLVTYTVIYVSWGEFADRVPYMHGVVEFQEGARLSGPIGGMEAEELKVGMEMKVAPSEKWPYEFRRVK